MPMTIDFVVEDGTGKTDATSYVSIQEFKDYWDNRLISYSSYSDDIIGNWLNLATQYADSICKWGGQIYDSDQALAIPRVSWMDKQGRFLDGTVPTFVKNGVCELAAIRQADNFETTSSVGLKSENYGPVSVTYSSDSSYSKIIYTTAMNWFRMGITSTGLRGIPT